VGIVLIIIELNIAIGIDKIPIKKKLNLHPFYLIVIMARLDIAIPI
jgi:hypothetical protein